MSYYHPLRSSSRSTAALKLREQPASLEILSEVTTYFLIDSNSRVTIHWIQDQWLHPSQWSHAFRPTRKPQVLLDMSHKSTENLTGNHILLSGTGGSDRLETLQVVQYWTLLRECASPVYVCLSACLHKSPEPNANTLPLVSLACHFHMLNKLLPSLSRIILRREVSGFNPSAFRFDRFGWSMMLLCNFVSDSDDGAVRRGFVEVVVEVFEGAVGCLGV